MSNKCKKFTDIKQYKDVIREIRSSHDYQGKDENGNVIYSHLTPYPSISWRCTIKNHGSNAGIVLYKDGTYEFQSRERVLTLQQDNADFMLKMSNKNYKSLFEGIEFNDSIVIYGEWCGIGIQKGVGISQLPKMFIIFAIKIDDVYRDMENYKHLKIEEENIYNILQFPHYFITIDFNKPEMSQNEIADLTLAIEKECPVAKYFGVSGVGEGLVAETFYNGNRYIFKSKGLLHQNSKVHTLATVDTEEVNGLNEFVEYACTENRMLQGIDKLRENGKQLDTTSTGDFLRWIVNDIHKEEEDTIIKNQINIKKVNSYISQKAREFYMKYIKENF
jgi:hypothetical protein